MGGVGRKAAQAYSMVARGNKGQNGMGRRMGAWRVVSARRAAAGRDIRVAGWGAQWRGVGASGRKWGQRRKRSYFEALRRLPKRSARRGSVRK